MFGGGMTWASQNTSPEKPQKRADDQQNCLPVTVRMLEAAHEVAKTGDGELRFHGSDASPGILLLLAQVEAIHAHQSGMAEFTICDSTSRMRARLYVSDASQEKALQGLATGQWVRLLGHFRSAPSAHFSVSVMRPLESADEISYHSIEVVHAALKCAKRNGIPMEAQATPPPKAVRQPMDEPMREASTPEKPTSQERQMMEVDSQLTQKLPGIQEAPALKDEGLQAAILEMLKVVRDGGSEEGLTAPEIFANLERSGSKVADGLDAVKIEVATLGKLGEIYETIDDFHFLAL
mmetsp:Transcript_32444/g.61106  ORF Transcript_32444/g.61106 Transcript_32444/m.61106 type:complete len:293 (-) Transcript_32444:130-1008(-)